MKILIKILVVGFGLLFLSCSSEIKSISTKDLDAIINQNDSVQLLDVRTFSECRQGTIPNSINIDVTSDYFESQAQKLLDKNKPVYLYCRSGGRSKIASEILFEKGFEVYNVEGGFKKWQKESK